MSQSPRLGVIIGNRDFFPDALVGEAREDLLRVLGERGVEPVLLSPEDTKLGGVETHADARRCAELFKRHRDEIKGILVSLPNFGDEKGAAEAIKLAGLNVPVLVQAYPDDLGQLGVARRRDAFCGKISVCNNLVQAGVKFSLTTRHVSHPSSEGFQEDLGRFLGVCRVVNGLRGVRLGAVGARPGAFNTVRYSEKILERHGVSVTTVDLSEFLAQAGKLAEDDPAVKAKLADIQGYAPAPGVPGEKLVAMARLGVVLSRWMEANAIDATAIQCWTSVQQNFGCNVCTLMSMMSERFMPSACEVDVTGVLTMYAMQLAAGSPAAIVDWNNNYGDDPDKCTLFHCGNWAKSFLPDIKIATAPILGSTLGVENTYGALEGRTPAGPLTYGRITTADAEGRIRAYVGDGELTNDELNTFGTRAVAHVPQLQRLLRYVCSEGFEHHVVMTQSHSAGVLAEAFGNYLGWETHVHPDDQAARQVMTDGELRLKSVRYRRDILRHITHAGAGHTGGSLSCVDILSVLYNRVLRVTPETASDPERDRYVQSKGHSVEALYVVLAERGFFPEAELETLCRYGSPFVGHPTRKIPGIEMNTGALGHGLPIAAGMALAGKLDGAAYRVFTLLGDGELAEGSNWEAAMAAAHYRLDNLTAIVDCNTLQITGRTHEVCSSEPVDEKFRSFGWHVETVDGHDLAGLTTVLAGGSAAGKPKCVIARTVKGRGVSFMADVVKWHHGVPSAAEYEQAIAELEQAERELVEAGP